MRCSALSRDSPPRWTARCVTEIRVMRSSACLLAIVLVAGCASIPEESLVWSAELARSLPRETGDVVEVARFSRSPPGAVGKPWEPYFVLRGNAPTMYQVVQLEESTALAADAEGGGSGL